MSEASINRKKIRRVSLPLIVGIVFLPVVFVWFLLKSGYSNRAKVISFGWLAIVVIAALGHSSGGSRPAATTAAAGPVATGPGAAPSQPKADTGWIYTQDKDQMRGTSSGYAKLQSDDTQSFDFPYHGGYTTLTLRKRPDGTDAYLEVNGQFLCNEYENATVAVKFDSGPIQRFECRNPQDGRTGMLFIEPATRLISQIRKAKTMTIEAQFFREGRHQMTFSVGGLDWK